MRHIVAAVMRGESMTKIRVTLPLSEAEREVLGAARAEYVKVRDAAWAECVKVHDAAWAEYIKVRRAARVEYDKVLGAAWVEYDKVRDAARAEYDKVHDAAWAEYGEAVKPLPLVAWIVEAFRADYGSEADDVVGALAGGAALDDLRELARVNEWCGAWDDALAAALERFDIVGEVTA